MQSSGLFDLQVNGFAGVDFNSGTITPDEMDHALEAMLATGVAVCLPTIITAHPHELEDRFRALDKAISESKLGPTMCPAYHLEGPFLNPADGFAGCHPPGAMTPANLALVERLQTIVTRPIMMVTVAPEIEGVPALIRSLTQSGIVVALGHTAANFDQVAAAADAGATLATHLGNGMPQQMHKLVNPIFAQLAEDRLWATFIADGIHLHPKALKALMRAKGHERAILVTDAVSAAAAKTGRYDFAGVSIDRAEDGSVRLAQNATSLAGSALCLDDGVRNIVKWGLATPQEAIDMASKQPRKVIEPALTRKGIKLPESGVEWSDDLHVTRIRIGKIERDFTRERAST